MRHAIMAAAVMALVGTACGPSAAPPNPRPASRATAFVHVAVVAMVDERIARDQTVVVRDGVIEAVGPAASTPVPAGATTIDGTGAYLVPGLADMHVHIFTDDQLALFVANGVTTVRNMWGQPDTLAQRHATAKGMLLGPRIVTAGPIFDGNPPIWPGSTVVQTAADARAAVAAVKRAGYDGIKVYNKLPREAYDAIIAAAAAAQLPVWGHSPYAVGPEGAIANQRTVEHLDGILRAIGPEPTGPRTKGFWRQGFGIDLAKLAPFAAAMRAKGTWSCPTLVVLADGFPPPERRTQLWARREMRFIPAMIRAFWDPANDFRTRSLPADAAAHWPEHVDGTRRVVKALHDAGVGLLVGTDTPNPNVIPGFAVHDELDAFVAAGLSPYAALRAATVAPAEMLGLRAQQGTIEPKQRADLVLVRGNPLADITALRRRAGVMVAGTYYSQAELDAKLEAIAASYVRPPPRFAGKPALAGELRWEIVQGDRAIAEERVRRDGRAIVARRSDDPPLATELVARIEPNWLSVTLETPHGGMGIEVSAAGDRLKLRGSAYGLLPLAADIARPKSGDAWIVPGTTVAPYVLIADRAATLAVGATLDITLVVVDVTQGKLVPMAFAATRAPDTAGRRTYTFRGTGDLGPVEGTFAVDAVGMPVEIEETSFGGKSVARRVQGS